MPFNFISDALAQRSAEGLLRERHVVGHTDGAVITVDDKHYLNFSSNDYLGLRQNPRVLQAWVEGLSLYGAGSGASPLVTGYTRAHKTLEDSLGEVLGRESVLLFNSGFAANQAICQAFLQSQCAAFADKLIHASFIEGAMSTPAHFRRFRHNTMSHLAELLEVAGEEDKLVASESVFSMDGDMADVPGLVAQCGRHDAWLMLDDAHGFGVLGENGLGAAEHWDLPASSLPILMGTFGKAIGTAGAFVAADKATIDYLLNFARHYVYSTAMPPAQAVATLHSVAEMQSGDYRKRLKDNIALFKDKARQVGMTLMPSDTAIQPIVAGNAHKALALSNKLRSLGIWVKAIRYPTVPKGTDRLRITLTADHMASDISALIDALELAFSEVEGR